MKKTLLIFLIACVTLLFNPVNVFAQVIVRPDLAGLAETVNFDVNVTSTHSATTSIKLLIPENVSDVVPNVKPGWVIILKKNKGTISEIDWVNGSIPQGERDDFYFQAVMPTKESTLEWKIFQTYEDGNVTAWINSPTDENDTLSNHDYSITKIIDKIKESPPESNSDLPVRVNFVMAVTLISLLLSSASFILQKRRK